MPETSDESTINKKMVQFVRGYVGLMVMLGLLLVVVVEVSPFIGILAAYLVTDLFVSALLYIGKRYGKYAE